MQLSLARALSLLSAGAALLLASPTTASSSSSSEPATTDVVLTFSPSPFLANPHALPASTTHGTLARLGAPAAHAPLTLANTLVFRNVSAGSYLADVHCATHGFAPLRVDVVPAAGGAALEVLAWETFRGNAWENKGEKAVPVQVGGGGRAALPVRCLGKKVFFQERGKFSVLSILKNPMILMGLVSMGIFFGMPKLVENMDPEFKAEWEEQQKNNPINSIMGGGKSGGNFDMAAFLAGSGGSADNNGAGNGGSSGSGGGNSGKKGGKR